MAKRDQKVSTSRIIAADRQALFDIVADPAMHPVIDGSGSILGPKGTKTERLGPGVRFGMGVKQGASYKVENTVVEFEEGSLLAWRHFNGHRWRYEFQDVDGGTRVTESFDWSTAKAKLPLVLAGFPKRNLRGMERTLERLEQLATTGQVEDAA